MAEGHDERLEGHVPLWEVWLIAAVVLVFVVIWAWRWMTPTGDSEALVAEERSELVLPDGAPLEVPSDQVNQERSALILP